MKKYSFDKKIKSVFKSSKNLKMVKKKKKKKTFDKNLKIKLLLKNSF
jgi:hypothetical protein